MPAAVYNGRYDVLAWNAAYRWLFPEVEIWPDGQRNALWQMFTTPACCSCILRKDIELPQMVATFRAAFGRHLGEPAWTGFVHRLTEASGEFAQMWAEHDVAGPGTRMKIFQNVAGELLHTVSTSLAVSAAPESRLVVYTPVGAADRALLDRLAAGPPTTRRCAAHVAQPAPLAVAGLPR
jgi:hypothetical protein